MEVIVRQFVDCQKVISVEVFGNGHINGTFRAEVLEKNEIKKYLLQRLNSNVFKRPLAVMQNIQLVATQLSSQGFPLKILAPIPTLAGELMYLDGAGNYWRLFPFFENTFTYEKVETTAQAYEAAKAFGVFAKALDGMNLSVLQTTIPHFHDGVFRLKFFNKILAKADEKKRAAAQKEIEKVLKNAPIFEKIAALKLPRRVVHHDTKINNLLFDIDTKKAIAVIDLDTVMPGVVLSDFGDLVRTSVSPVEEDEADLSKVIFRKEIYESISSGFLSEMGELLTEEERQYLPLSGPWLTLMQAMRFLTDYLAGDVYYSVKYADHNLVRARCQLRFFREMYAGLNMTSS